MPFNRTILCASDVRTDIAAFLLERGGVVVDGDPARWSRLRLPALALVLTSRMREAPGDEFSKMKIGLFSLFGGLRPDHERTAVEDLILHKISETKLAIGVVGAEEVPSVAAIVDEIARHVDAVIFDGVAMRSGDQPPLIAPKFRRDP